jgi:hypothetical protein
MRPHVDAVAQAAGVLDRAVEAEPLDDRRGARLDVVRAHDLVVVGLGALLEHRGADALASEQRGQSGSGDAPAGDDDVGVRHGATVQARATPDG